MILLLKRLTHGAAPLLFFILILGFWETGFRLRWWKGELFPGPSVVWMSLVSGMRDGSLLAAMKISLVRLIVSFLLAMLVGILLGLLNGTISFFHRTSGVLALGLQALPSICWLPLAIAWFGISEMSILFVTFMGALLAITIAVSDGVRNVSPLYLRAARMMGAGGLRLYREVILPAALPSILSGAKQGWTFAWRSLMAGELIAVSTKAVGLGQTLMLGRKQNDMSLVLAVMSILIVIGILADRLVFTRLEHRLRARWGLTGA